MAPDGRVVESSCVSLAGGRLADVRAVTESDDRECTGSGVKVGHAATANLMNSVTVSIAATVGTIRAIIKQK